MTHPSPPRIFAVRFAVLFAVLILVATEQRGTKVTPDVAAGVDLSTPSNPAAFDYRKIGNSLEVELKVDTMTKLISLELSPQVVGYVGETACGNGLAEARQPTFHVILRPRSTSHSRYPISRSSPSAANPDAPTNHC